MPIQVKDQLWRLIKSLNKAEKRNFKLFATRAGSTEDSKFIRLFNALDRLDKADDKLVTNQLQLSKGQYSNLKRHLYQQLLTSLRLIYIKKEIDIELREQIDFSRILYGKGHYLDALRTLERAKARAVDHHLDLLHLEILEFQKLIEARHVTLSRQEDNKMDLLLDESAGRSYTILSTSELFNLNIQIHGHYIEEGHARTAEELAANEEFWQKIQPKHLRRDSKQITFHEKINRFQSDMWYHYIQLRFSDALNAANDARNLFETNQAMVLKDPDLFLRCLYYVSLFAYLTGQADLVEKQAWELETFLSNKEILLNENSRRIGNIYAYLARYNFHFLTGEHQAALNLSQDISQAYEAGDFRPNDHRWGLFLYKAAAACFLNARYEAALDHLNDIINMRGGILREDLLINTRLLHALCNFELRHYSLVEYHLTNISRVLRRSSETAELHKLTASVLRRLLKTPVTERGPVFESFSEQISSLSASPFEGKALLYLDLRAWLRVHLPKLVTV